jgi:hypothetical protein
MADPRYDPAFQRGYEPVPEALEGTRRNPWLIVLWILAVVLTATGATALYYSEQALNAPNPENSVAFSVSAGLLQSVGPWLFGVGLATLSGVVFVHAVQWRR